MCIGTPMQVVDVHEFSAVCHDGTRTHLIDTTLLPALEPGMWILAFLGAARDILDEADALLMKDALSAVSSIMGGDTDINHLFADLIDREPQLPPHLQAALSQTEGKA